MAIPTSSSKVTRQVQFYPETNGYNQPVTNPVLENAGVIRNVDINLTVDHEEIRIQGSRKLYADIMMGIEGVITVDYAFLDTVLLNYAILDPAGPGTIEESFGLIFARKIDNVEKFCMATGCVSESVTITNDRVPAVSQQIYSPNISAWLTLAQLQSALNLGTGTPQWATPISDEPWTHLTGSDDASTSVTINGVATDIARMSVTVNNSLLKQKPLGYKNVKHVEAGNKIVSVSIEPFLYGNDIYDLVNNHTLHNIVARLKNSTPTVDLSVIGAKLNSYTDTSDASGGDFITTPVNGIAVDATATPFP